MRSIHEPVVRCGAGIAGETFSHSFENFCREAGTIQKFPFTMVSPGGVYCAGKGCSRCRSKGCIYSEFVRLYWNHPVFD